MLFRFFLTHKEYKSFQHADRRIEFSGAEAWAFWPQQPSRTRLLVFTLNSLSKLNEVVGPDDKVISVMPTSYRFNSTGDNEHFSSSGSLDATQFQVVVLRNPPEAITNTKPTTSP